MTRQPDDPWTDLSSPETAAAVAAYVAAHPTTSNREIAEALGIGRSTALRAIHRLRNEGVVHVDRLGTGDGYPTRYTPPAHPPAPATEPTPVPPTPAAGESSDSPAPTHKKTRRGRRRRKRPADWDSTP